MSTKAEREQAKQEAIEHLRSLLQPGDYVYMLVRSYRAESGNRTIDVYALDKSGRYQPPLRWVTRYAGELLGLKYNPDRRGFTTDEDPPILVYQLSRALFGDGSALNYTDI